uniref:Proteasome subunit beta n=1 Tax=Acrobeloides nanus TaxID=290746 RepID=A0A914DZA1_9BILA
MAGTSFLAGVRTKDFVILASDKIAFAFGAIVVSEEDNKELKLGDRLYMTCMGEGGDVSNFGEWVMRNLHLYKLRNGYEISPKAAHHWIRRAISENLRTEDHWQVDLLLGGYDVNENKAFLGSVDYLGTGIADQNFLFRGFPGRFAYAIMDKAYREDLNETEAIDLIRKCLAEAKKRFIVNLPAFRLLIIDKNGARHLADITF